MANRSRVRETEVEISAEIERQILEQADVRLAVEKTAKDVQAAARSFAPVRSGKYAAGIEVRKRPDVDGLPVRVVVATDLKSDYIEFGTGLFNPRHQGGHSPAFAPMEKAANTFGGSLDGVSAGATKTDPADLDE